MLRRRILALMPAATMLIGLSNCGDRAETPPPSPDAEHRYEIRGTIVSVDAAARKAVIAHEKIADLMDAMTMSFSVPEAADLAKLQAGKFIKATLVVEHNTMWMEGVEVLGDAPAPADPSAAHSH
ncbi:MAG: copper-binding protein [Bryobacterales bacterium]|nr:copper-binding protein [Bryobacterales bacterium]